MTTPPEDPAKWLATIIENSQAMMRQFAQPGMAGAGSDDKSVPPVTTSPVAPDPFLAASKQFAEMQQNYVRQMTDLWSGMWKLPGTPRRPPRRRRTTGALPPKPGRRIRASTW